MYATSPCIYVKVVGFRQPERHAIHTLIRLSVGRPVSYAMWSVAVTAAPQLVLLDMEVDEAEDALAACEADPLLKVICVGGEISERAHFGFQRPLYWPEVVRAMDSLFPPDQVSSVRALIPVAFAEPPRLPTRQGPAPTLLIHPTLEDRLYLRARLALAGLTDVDDACNGAQAFACTQRRRYRLLIVGLDLPDMKAWDLVRRLTTQKPSLGAVFVISADTSWHLHEHAAYAGCSGVLQKPYNPTQIMELLQKV